MWSGAAAHRGGERLLVVDHRREVERAHHDALVGDAEPDPLGQLVLGEERLERLRQSDGVGDFAVADHAGLELGDRATSQREGAIDADLGGREMARVELEPDDAALGGTLLTEHKTSIGTRAPGLDRAATPEALNERSGPEGPLRGGGEV